MPRIFHKEEQEKDNMSDKMYIRMDIEELKTEINNLPDGVMLEITCDEEEDNELRD